MIHFYNSTSVAQREQVFHKSKEEIKQIAVDGAKLVKQLSEEYEGNFLFEYLSLIHIYIEGWKSFTGRRAQR